MINADADMLECDLAETYNIYDMKRLPPSKVAVFSCGLGNNSRIKLKLNGQTIDLDTTLKSIIADRLSTLVWMKTKDAEKGINHPKSILKILNGFEEEKKKEHEVFNSKEDFENAWKKIIMKGDGNYG